MATRKSSHGKKSASTRAGKYVREEMDEKKHGNPRVKSRSQAIAIGLSRARKAGLPISKKPKKSRESRVTH